MNLPSPFTIPWLKITYCERVKRLQRLRYDSIDGTLLYCLRYHMRRPQRIPIIKTGSGRSRYKTTWYYINASFAVALGRRQRRRLCRRHRRAINAIDIVASIFSTSAPSQHSSEWIKGNAVDDVVGIAADSYGVRPPVGRNSKHVSLQTTRLWGLSCTVRHAISKTTAGRSKFQIRVGTYNSCLEPAYLRSQLPSNSDFPISWSFALSLLLKFRSISNAIVYCSLKIKLTFLGISRKYYKDLFKKISSAAHGAKKKNCTTEK